MIYLCLLEGINYFHYHSLVLRLREWKTEGLSTRYPALYLINKYFGNQFQQAKIKQEAKEKAEKERREREEKDRLRDDRERERLELERDVTPEPRRSSISHTYVSGSNNTYIT